MKVLVFLALLFLVFTADSEAQVFHVSIEPTVIQVDSMPPAKFEAPFQIRNLSSSSITLTSSIVSLEPQEDGKVTLRLNSEADLADFVKEKIVILDGQQVVEKLELRAGETKQLRLFMEVAEGDPAGDYYFSIVFTSDGTILDETSTSAIPAGIAMNVLVSIGPKVSSTGRISEFSTNNLVGSGPVFFKLKLENTGNHLIQPEGKIEVKNMFGKVVGDIKILPQYVLAQSSRYLIDATQASPPAELTLILSSKENDEPEVIWTEKFLLGLYTAEVELELEDGGSKIIEKVTFFAIPVQFVLILSGIIFVILGIGLRIRYKTRKTMLIRS